MENLQEIFSNSSSVDLIINLAEIIIGISSFFGNFFIVFLWLSCKKLRVKRNSFLISLSIANIFTSIFAVPLTIFVSNLFKCIRDINELSIISQTHHGYPNEKDWCLFEISTIVSIRTAVNFGIVAISIDRLVAVQSPFEYRCNSSKITSTLIISFCWLFALLFGYSIIFLQSDKFERECKIYKIIGRKQLLAYSVLGKIIPAVMLVIIYGFIFWGVKRVRNYKSINLEIIKNIFV